MFIDQPRSLPTFRHWRGDMEADHYLYTSGLAGEAFFTTLRDEGQFLASECTQCQRVYVPAFLYCWHCLERLEETYRKVEGKGIVETFTALRIDTDGTLLDEPELRALIRIGKASNRLPHRLAEIALQDVAIGLQVEPVLRPIGEREGRITDILYFRPTT